MSRPSRDPSMPCARSLALSLLVAAPLAAQARVRVTPFVGVAATSTIFAHRFMRPPTSETQPYGRARRLRLDDARVAGLRLERDVRGGFALAGAMAVGRSELEYWDVVAYPLCPTCMTNTAPPTPRRAPATLTTFSAGAARTFAVGIPRVALGLDAGASLRRVGLSRRSAVDACPGGSSSACAPPDAWARRYWIPGVEGGASGAVQLTGALALEARAAATVGRANTQGFAAESPDARVPGSTIAGAPDAPRSQRVRGRMFSLGLAYRP